MPDAARREFQLAELRAFLEALAAGELTFLPVDRYMEATRAFYAASPRPPAPSFGHLKLDIHHNIDRAARMAEMLRDIGIGATFYMMHRHPVNAKVYDLPETWDAIRAIADCGHEIGLHADPFVLVREHRSLYAGVGEAAGDLRKRGFPVRAMTLHGDTSPTIKHAKLLAHDFFDWSTIESSWDGRAPFGEAWMGAHLRRYSRQTLSRAYGIHYCDEGFPYMNGEPVSRSTVTYLTDNPSYLRATSRDENTLEVTTVIGRPARLFRIDPDLAQEMIPLLTRKPFVALIHPQWYD